MKIPSDKINIDFYREYFYQFLMVHTCVKYCFSSQIQTSTNHIHFPLFFICLLRLWAGVITRHVLKICPSFGCMHEVDSFDNRCRLIPVIPRNCTAIVRRHSSMNIVVKLLGQWNRPAKKFMSAWTAWNSYARKKT